MRDLYTKVGKTSQKDFNNLIKSNIISNFPVTLEEPIRADKIYGPNISTLKGKTAHSKPYPVVTEYITVPKEIIKANKNITISGDILFFNKIPFFETINCNIKFATIECIINRNLKQLTHSMVTVKSVYIKICFDINTALMDREFEPMRVELKNMKTDINLTSTNKHIPDIELQIYNIKEIARACHHTFPFKHIQ